MNLNETQEFLIQVRVIWRTVDTSPSAVKVWQRLFAAVDLSAAEKALDAYMIGVSGDDYPPKPADILRLLVRSYLSLPTEDDAWMMVVAEATRAGMGRSYFHDGVSYPIRPCIPIPEVALAAESIGWRLIVTTAVDPKQGIHTQRNYREAYARYCARTREAALLMEPDELQVWRWNQARNLPLVKLRDPETLYDLGAPPAFAALIDGSGPDAPALVASLTPDEPPTPVVSAAIAGERRAVLEARTRVIAGRTRSLATGGQTVPPRSIFADRKAIEG